MRSSARCALRSDLRCLRLDPGDMLYRMMGPSPAFLEVCLVRAMEKKAAVESESCGGAAQGRRRRRCGGLGRSVEARSITATVRSRAAYKASLVRRCGPAIPLGAEAEEAVQLSRFLPLGLNLAQLD